MSYSGRCDVRYNTVIPICTLSDRKKMSGKCRICYTHNTYTCIPGIYFSSLILTLLLKPKVISLCHQASLLFHEVCSGFILLADQLSSSHFNIPKNDNGKFQKWKVDYSICEIKQIKG